MIEHHHMQPAPPRPRVRGSVKVAFLILTLAALTSLARAEPNANPIELHVNGGVEMTGGGGVFGGAFRGRVGVGQAFGHGDVRPTLVLGATASTGAVYIDDPRAIDGSLDIHVRTYGPEAQVGLRFVNGGSVDSRVFASAALLRTSLDSRLMLDHVPGVSTAGNLGFRAALGANIADHVWYLLPQQLELVYERDAGSNRFGALIGFGI